MPATWRYNGRHAALSATSAVPAILRPNGEGGGIIPHILAMNLPMEGKRAIWSVPLNGLEMSPTTVLVGGRPRIWAINANHMSARRQPSPFVRITPKDQPVTNIVTVVLHKTGWGEYVVARAHFGEYVPPLPWMQPNAKRSPGGTSNCREYWRLHAYLLNNINPIVLGTASTDPPRWWLR